MTEAEFNKVILTVYNIGMTHSFIATGLPLVDPTIPEMKYIRVMEILDKVGCLNLTPQERKAIQEITDLGDLDELRKNLAYYWFEKNKKK